MKPKVPLLLLSCLLQQVMLADEFHVSVDGNDLQSGSAAAPFRTIAKASSAASPGDTVIIHAGTYQESLRPARSGTSLAPISYRANRSGSLVDEVMISSFDTIVPGAAGTGTWQTHSGNIYKILLPAGTLLPSGQNMVAIEVAPLREARWPNAPRVVDFRRTHMARADGGGIDPGSNDGTGTYTGWYDDDALGAFPSGAWNGGYIQLVAQQGWWQKTGLITDFTGQRVTFRYAVSSLSRETPSKMDPFYLFGRLAALDEPGEFFLDVDGLDGPANTLYIWLPDSANPATRTVQIKTRPNAADLTSRSHIHLNDLSFIGGRIYANTGSTNLEIDACTVLYGAYDANLYDPWDGASRGAIQMGGSSHLVTNSNVLHTMTNGIVARDSFVEVTNCVVFNAWQLGIKTDDGTHLSINDNTVFDTGSAVISIGSPASQFLANHVFRGGQHITDVELMNTYNSGDALGTEVAWNWVHDNRAEEEAVYGWNGGGGIRLDSGDSANGCSNYLIHHNVVWDAGSRGISIWALDPGMENYGSPDGAKIYVYNNTTNSSVGIRAGQDATGIHLKNNLALDGLYFGNAAHASAATLANNRQAALSDFASAVGHIYELDPASPAVDGGTLIPGITDGFMGAAPDIGAYESGPLVPVPGARIREEDLHQLHYSHKILNDGSSVIEVSGLPLGRTVPDGMQLRIGGSLVLSGFYRTWDFESGQFSARYPFDYASIGFTDVSIEHGLDGGSFTTAVQGLLGIRQPMLASASASKLTPGEAFTISGTSLHGYDHYRIPIHLPHLVADDLRIHPLPLRFDSAALIASGHLDADGSDLWFPVGDTGLRLQFAIESGWNTPYTLIWLRFPPDAPTFREEQGLACFLACGGKATPEGDQLDLAAFFNYIDFDQLALWLRPDSVTAPLTNGAPVSQWSDLSGLDRHAFQADPARQPALVLSANRPPAVQFDGVNDFLHVGDLSPIPGSFDSWTVYRTPNPGTTPHQRTYSATASSHPDPSKQTDYLGGLADLPEREPDGTPVIYPESHMTSLSRADKYPEDLVIGARSNAGNPIDAWFKGEITEILVFSGNLPESVGQRIEENYLAMKYALEAWDGYHATLDTGSILFPTSITLAGIPITSFSLQGQESILFSIPDLGPEAAALDLSILLPDGSLHGSPEPLFYYTLPYDGWRIDHFSDLPQGPLGPDTDRTGDADLDGKANFAEFAFDEDPLSSTVGPNWPSLIQAQGQLHLALTTGQPASDVTYTVQFSYDLSDWSDPAPVSLPVSTAANTSVQVPLSPSPAAPVFTRVQATETP